MTTAPDLPLPPATRAPRLAVVPEQPDHDALAFDAALRRAEPRLKRYAARRLRDEHEAEEVVQEALLRGFQHRHLLATEDDLMAWLTVVTGRLVIDRLRVRGRTTPVAELPPASRAGRDTADVVVARDEARIALDALEAMPGRQASVLWAREVEGLSYDEIGERFGMTEPSVRSLLHRARRTLRREYAVRGGTLPGVGLIALAPWLGGLRLAGKLRHVARRAAGTAAVTATGLAAIAVVPFTSPQIDRAPAPPTKQAVKVAPSGPVHHRSHAVAAHSVATRPVAATAPAAPVRATRQVTSTRLPTPAVCGPHDASVGCETHVGQTLYVGPSLPVPVGGVHRVGVSSTRLDCSDVPTTPVTQCDTRGESP